MDTTTKSNNLFNATLGLLGYTILVILWGAWVRISHSGNGCGDTWPLCQGVLIPAAERPQTWIEFSHRLMSGFYGILVFLFYIRLRKNPNPLIAQTAKWVLIFTVSEALLGAKLVLFGLVGNNDSLYRAFVMALHLVNSFFLVSWTTRLMWLSSNLKNQIDTITPINQKELRSRWLFPGSILLIAIFGAWAALANTLFPAANLLEGWTADFNQESHWLVKIRIYHPIIAISLGSISLYSAFDLAMNSSNALIKKLCKNWLLALAIGLVFGLVTLFSLAPVWMKLTHLFIGYCLWIGALIIRFQLNLKDQDKKL